MPSSSNTRERPRIEPITAKGTLSAADSLSLHWPEYLMEAGEAGLYLFCPASTISLGQRQLFLLINDKLPLMLRRRRAPASDAEGEARPRVGFSS